MSRLKTTATGEALVTRLEQRAKTLGFSLDRATDGQLARLIDDLPAKVHRESQRVCEARGLDLQTVLVSFIRTVVNVAADEAQEVRS